MWSAKFRNVKSSKTGFNSRGHLPTVDQGRDRWGQKRKDAEKRWDHKEVRPQRSTLAIFLAGWPRQTASLWCLRRARLNLPVVLVTAQDWIWLWSLCLRLPRHWGQSKSTDVGTSFYIRDKQGHANGWAWRACRLSFHNANAHAWKVACHTHKWTYCK